MFLRTAIQVRFIVRFLVDVFDETRETVAIATILRSRKLDQN